MGTTTEWGQSPYFDFYLSLQQKETRGSEGEGRGTRLELATFHGATPRGCCGVR